MTGGLLQPLDLSKREGTTISISRQLLDYLLSGRVQPGDRLPPERKLAEALGVGRSVVREALKSLTLLGLLEVRLGDGTYVKRVDADILPESIEWGLVLGAGHVPDLLEARRHLDVILAGLAAVRRDERDMADLRSLHAAMKAAHRDPPAVRGRSGCLPARRYGGRRQRRPGRRGVHDPLAAAVLGGPGAALSGSHGHAGRRRRLGHRFDRGR